MEPVRNINLTNVNFTSRRNINASDVKNTDNTVKDTKKHSNALKWMAIIAAAGICTAGALQLAYKKGKLDTEFLMKAKDAVKDVGEITTPIALTAAGTAVAASKIKESLSDEQTVQTVEEAEKEIPQEANLDYRISNFNEYNTRRIKTASENLEFLKEHVSKLSPEKIALMPDNQLASLLYVTNDSKIMLRLKKIEQLENEFTNDELKKMFKYYHDGDFRAWLDEDRDVIGCQRFEDAIHGTSVDKFEEILAARKLKEQEKVIALPQIEPKKNWFSRFAEKAVAAMF